MADLNNFNANNVEPDVGFDPVPQGKYTAIIVESENKKTKRGDGSYLQIKFQILDGKYGGRNVWARLNLENRNDQAVQLAQAELSAICRAVNVMTPKDSNELHDLPLEIDVRCEKRQDNGDMSNVIKGYKAKSSLAAQASTEKATDQSAPWSG